MKEFITGLTVMAGLIGVAEWDSTVALYLAGMIALGLVAYRVARRG